jgi:hypothetical protein
MRRGTLVTFAIVGLVGVLMAGVSQADQSSAEICRQIAPSAPRASGGCRYEGDRNKGTLGTRVVAKFGPKNIFCAKGHDGEPCGCDGNGKNCQGVCKGIACCDPNSPNC